MLPVDLFVRAPFWMLRDECVFAADYFALKVSSETRVVFR